jgi:cbb3-type cytochrome oxidase subunit 3
MEGGSNDIADLSCNEALNHILFSITDLSNLFFVLSNGLYLGQMGDYGSCMQNSNNGAYFLATLTGEYEGDYPFARGVFSKYLNTFSTQVGICAPAQCSVENITRAYEPLLTQFATTAQWKNPRITVLAASQDVTNISHNMDAGKAFSILIFVILFVFVGLATFVHLFSLGDKENAETEVFQSSI